MQIFTAKKNSIKKKILLPMLVALFIQTTVFFGITFLGGTITQLENNSFAILKERVANRAITLQTEMIQRWANIGGTVNAIHTKITELTTQEKKTPTTITPETPLMYTVLDKIMPNIIQTLRKNEVTGAFLILDGETKKDKKFGIYIRDLEPLRTPGKNSDLLVERAPIEITKKYGTMDTWWEPQFSFEDEMLREKGAYDFYFKPFNEALKNPEIGFMDLGYWSKPFRLSEKDSLVITFSVPLMDEKGVPYGVYGIELSVDYLQRLLPYWELKLDDTGGYLLAMTEASSLQYEPLVTAGALTKRLGESAENGIQLDEKSVFYSIHTLKNSLPKNNPMYACVQKISLYNTNTPFEQQEWALIGVARKNELLASANQLKARIASSGAFSFLLSFLFTYLVSISFSHPITALADKVRNSNASLPLTLEKVHIAEIDELASAIELLNTSVMDSASKLSQIIQLASIPLGAFEYRKTTGKIFCTEYFFTIFRYKLLLGDDQREGYMEIEDFRKKMDNLKPYQESLQENDTLVIYKIPILSTASYAWIRLKIVHIFRENTEQYIGVVQEITQEMLEKIKIEHERDYDLLTNLLNRLAFHNALERLFNQPKILQNAVLVMLDLDDLKFMNDTYGHNCGDAYIVFMADTLRKYTPPKAITSRMSGDEFYVLWYGYDSKQELRRELDVLIQGIRHAIFTLPNGESCRLRASGGYAWYPDDSVSYEDLLKYADFAMYCVKNTTKNAFQEFDAASYHEESILINQKEELNKFIDQKLLTYTFQPIVDVKTGEIFAYEALMCSQLSSLTSTLDILSLARSESKLYEMERLTWFLALDCFTHLPGIATCNCKLFINSLSNQILCEKDMLEFETKFSSYLSRLVIELTESEKLNENFTLKKQEYITRWQSNFALDDFGTGYNSDAALLYLLPDYIKIDMEMVRNIDKDEKKQRLFYYLTSYTRERKIKVIAEGVETEEELRTLIQYGVDYVQGYYLGRPDFTIQQIPEKIQNQMRTFYQETLLCSDESFRPKEKTV